MVAPYSGVRVPRCGTYEETVQRTVSDWNDAYFTKDGLLRALGLQEEIKDRSTMNRTKRILLKWEKETN